jgi:hypothetical protein
VMISRIKRRTVLAVATLAALLIFCSSVLRAAQQTNLQRWMENRAAQRAAAEENTLQILSQDWKQWTTSDCEAVLNYSVWGEQLAS